VRRVSGKQAIRSPQCRDRNHRSRRPASSTTSPATAYCALSQAALCPRSTCHPRSVANADPLKQHANKRTRSQARHGRREHDCKRGGRMLPARADNKRRNAENCRERSEKPRPQRGAQPALAGCGEIKRECAGDREQYGSRHEKVLHGARAEVPSQSLKTD